MHFNFSLCFKILTGAFILIVSNHNVNAQVQNLSKTASIRPAVSNDSVKTYLALAQWFQEAPQYNRDSVNGYFLKAVIFLENKTPIPYYDLANAYMLAAKYNYYFQFYVHAEKYGKLAQQYVEKLTSNDEATNLLRYEIYFIRAVTLVSTGEYKSGLDYYKNAYKLQAKNQTPLIKAKVLRDRGFFYMLCSIEEFYKQSEGYLLESEKIFKAAGIPETSKEYQKIYSSLADYYFFFGQKEKKQIYMKKLFNNAANSNNPYFAAYPYTVNGLYLLSEKKYQPAIESINQSKKLLEKYGMHRTNYYQYNLFILGDIAKEKKEYIKAIEYYKASKSIAKELNFTITVLENLKNLAEVYSLLNDYKSAFAAQKEFNELNTKYITERSERSIREQELEHNIAEKEHSLEIYRTNRNFLLAGLIILILLSGAIYFSFSKQKELNKLLHLRNTEKDILLKEVHHRVKNNLTVINSLIEMQSETITDELSKSILLQCTNRIRSIALIHQNLYQTDNLALIELSNFTDDLCFQIIKILKEEQQIVVTKNNIPHLLLDIDTAVPLGLILNELLTNSFKYAFNKNLAGLIEINLTKITESEFELVYSDNGPGLPPDIDIMSQKSMGLRLIHRLALQMKGNLTLKKADNRTQFVIRFKYRNKK